MSLVSVLFNPLRAIVYNAFGASMRWALNFDGVGVRGQLANRAINPDGDNTLEFYSPSGGGLQSIIMQTLSVSGASREFGLYFDSNLNAGTLIMNFGGAFNALCSAAQGFELGKKYWLTLVGTTFTLAKGAQSNVIRTASFTRGTVREPNAVTIIGSLSNGSGGFSSFFQGVQRDVRINGKLYPMRDYNQAIQLPLPTGLGDELITQSVLENPAVKGTQWTYLGDGRWQYVGDGTINALEFITQSAQPNSGFLEFEIESIAGNLVCSYASLSSSLFTTTGVKRYFYTNKSADVNSAIQFKRNAPGVITSCIIKNISFKPLGTCNPMTISNAASTNWVQVANDYDPKFRKVLNFDGVGARGVLAKRAIDPDVDIDIEFQTGPVVPVAGGGTEYTVLSQCLTATFANKEFNLYFNSSAGSLQMQVGGAYSASSASVTLSPNTIYRALLQGTSLKFFKNGQSLLSTSFTRGAAREPTAQTVIGANTHGAPTTFRASARGMFYNIKINGTLWPIADANQTIQLPSPTGLGAELITATVLKNPAVKGTQWTYLGDGRWQYIGDGSYNPLRFIASTEQPNAAYIEYEVEAITGTITTAFNNPSAVVSTVGIKRYFFTDKGVNEANVFEFKRASGGIVAACIIKNISFKPLGACNPITLANVTRANWEDLEI